jgi:hypothetical protein
MGLLTNISPLALWQEVVKTAENRCAINLREELESYLISLLMRYTNKPELAKQILATAYLEAMQQNRTYREISLQHVGDQCLIFAGLFPRLAETRHVKLSYFVDLGRSAYSAVSHQANDLFGSLAIQFVLLMDVLQSIRYPNDMSPLEAYAQWHDVGSQLALNILQSYTKAAPFKRYT